MANFIENPIKIYLKDSDKARLADYRARIVRETSPLEPCDNEDLVFEKAGSTCFLLLEYSSWNPPWNVATMQLLIEAQIAQ